MFRRLMSRAHAVRVRGVPIRFRGAEDLSRLLADRCAPSPTRTAALGGLPDAALVEARREMEALEQRIAGALSAGSGAGEGPLTLLRGIDTGRLTDDQDWPDLLAALAGSPGVDEDCARVALRRFLDYLAASRAVVEALGSARAGPGSRGAPPDDDPAAEQQLSFDLARLAAHGVAPSPADERDEALERIPKGETLEVVFDPHQSLDMMLARYRYVLVSGAPFLLVDEHGNDLRLRPGRNIVGRSAECDVVLPGRQKALSRRHLIVEAGPDTPVRLTDISTLGTFVPRGLLAARLH